MIELVLVVTDYAPPEERSSGAQRPRLPLLERLLSRARSSALGADWRGWLAASAAPAGLAGFSPAAIAGASFRGSGVPKPESTGYWLATPVHFFAGLDSVHLHPEGLLSLTAEEQAHLVRDFGRVFADSPWRLEAIGHRELLLSGPPLQADGADPARSLGDDPSAGLARGDGAPALRRLGSEIEMWLYEHPVNAARLSRHELPVTALWLWGGQPPALPAGVGRLVNPQLFGVDIYAQSLWQLQGLRALALSAASRAIGPEPMSLSCDSVVLLTNGLQELEQHWLPGAQRALRQRRLSALHLILGEHLFRLSSLHWLRFWRSPIPWWEALV
ncbi:MAG TPA: hypothetical protein VNZ06_02300 [Steroidobacteraceae bacterium]|nr:hypothetical protein [Steroidobacteraceae bacterium]